MIMSLQHMILSNRALMTAVEGLPMTVKYVHAHSQGQQVHSVHNHHGMVQILIR